MPVATLHHPYALEKVFLKSKDSLCLLLVMQLMLAIPANLRENSYENKEAIFGFMQSYKMVSSCLSCRISCTTPSVTCTLSPCTCRPHLQAICMSSGHIICSIPHGQHGPKLSFYSDRNWLLNGICHKNVELFHFRII